MILWGIILLGATIYAAECCTGAQAMYWDIMTIPCKIATFAIPCAVCVVCGLVWSFIVF